MDAERTDLRLSYCGTGATEDFPHIFIIVNWCLIISTPKNLYRKGEIRITNSPLFRILKQHQYLPEYSLKYPLCFTLLHSYLSIS